jgi:hypothetical protein
MTPPTRLMCGGMLQQCGCLDAKPAGLPDRLTALDEQYPKVLCFKICLFAIKQTSPNIVRPTE